jgi:hypothetical protein
MAVVSISCDQCEAAMINGVFCHESGCVNSGCRWESGEWVAYRECWYCGYDVRVGDTCSCEDDPMADEMIAAEVAA